MEKSSAPSVLPAKDSVAMSVLDEKAVRECLETFDFTTLFVEELGWDRAKTDNVEVVHDNRSYLLRPVAQKRGLVVFRCDSEADVGHPDHATRRTIEKHITGVAHEHIIVFTSRDTQHWQWVKREHGKPERVRQHVYRVTDSGRSLIQKLAKIKFTIDQEENLELLDVTGKVEEALNVENVTKKFYEHFSRELVCFQQSIGGIHGDADREWYASVMLNRLMFTYFIQKMGHLDNDRDYLRTRLETPRSRTGDNDESSYYRDFLLTLFYEGFSKPPDDRVPNFVKILGDVPYLNSGLFEKHTIEVRTKQINIPDKAFRNVYDFFEQYQWHLDSRVAQNDNEINPDVLGHIFEKFVNQKQMGAYYTKKDITEYIARNTIIPRLLDRVQRHHPDYFRPGGPVWRKLSDEPDRYIFPSVGHGIAPSTNSDKGITPSLPTHISASISGPDQNRIWHTQAPKEIAHPTESWHECIARRNHYTVLRDRIAQGEITSSDCLITHNLDLRRFVSDIIADCNEPTIVLEFWEAVSKITILDPTCGSGAFLFAALDLLEPIYSSCLDAMRGFDGVPSLDGQPRSDTHKQFEDILSHVEIHSNERYFVLKSIIVSNLYGVDIMNEAVEICKLRLFLKIAAQIEPGDTIEPLPDLDFNIQCGNALIGLSTRRQLEAIKTLVTKDELDNIMENIDAAGNLRAEFHRLQMADIIDSRLLVESKAKLRESLGDIRAKLNLYYAHQCGIDVGNDDLLNEWEITHRPFHWIVEYQKIVSAGGFDAIIGNPPYIKATKVRKSYGDLAGTKTWKCPDIYAWVMERSTELLRVGGRCGMITPLSLGFNAAFKSCREVLLNTYCKNWFSSFGRIPSALFGSEVRTRNTIHIGIKAPSKETLCYTTRLHRWSHEARESLFDNILYIPFNPDLWDTRVPKFNTPALASAFESAMMKNPRLSFMVSTQKRPAHTLYFKQVAYNWLTVCRKLPPCYINGKEVPHTKIGSLGFRDEQLCNLAMLLASGKIMFVFWLVVGDDFNVTKQNFLDFPADLSLISTETQQSILGEFSALLMAMKNSVQFKSNAGRRVGTYNLLKCRSVTDKTDALFAKSLGLDKVLSDIDLYCSQVIASEIEPPHE